MYIIALYHDLIPKIIQHHNARSSVRVRSSGYMNSGWKKGLFSCQQQLLCHLSKELPLW